MRAYADKTRQNAVATALVARIIRRKRKFSTACYRLEAWRILTNFLIRKNIKPFGFLLEARHVFAV